MEIRHIHLLIALGALLGAGCASEPEPEIHFPTLEIWDCRGDRPRRLNRSEVTSPEAGRDPFLPCFQEIVPSADGAMPEQDSL